MITWAKVSLAIGLLPAVLIPALFIVRPSSDTNPVGVLIVLLGAYSGPAGVITAVIGLVTGSSPRWALIAGGVLSLAWFVFVFVNLSIHP